MSVDSVQENSFYSDMNKVSNINYTEKGTKVVKAGEDMDKDAFLRILTAELSNQDPMNTKDSTQFVAQMAQFTSLEQMSNLNTTMMFTGASSLIGKTVGLRQNDSEGNQYVGIVRSVSKEGNTVKLSVEVGEGDNTELKEFKFEDVVDVTDINLSPQE